MKLFKWAVAVKSPEMKTWESLGLQKLFAAQLLAIIEETAVRRFIIHSGNGHYSKDALLVGPLLPKAHLRTALTAMADLGLHSHSRLSN